MVVFCNFWTVLIIVYQKKNHILIKIFKVDLIGNLLTTQPPVVTFFKKKEAKFMFLYSVKWCLVKYLSTKVSFFVV